MDTPPRDDSPLQKLRERLYAPRSIDGLSESRLQNKKPPQPEGWKHSDAEILAPVRKARFGIPTLFLFFAAGFFVLALIVSGVVLFLGGRSLSSDHVNITVEGPATVAGGDTVSLLVSVENGNPLAMKGANMSIDFPDGSYQPDKPTVPLTHSYQPLGDIEPGASAHATIRAAFFGDQNKKIQIPITIEYGTDNSSATFVSKKTYEFVIGSAPVSVTVNTLSEVSSGKPVTLLIKVRNNASAELSNIAVRADYPFGFIPTGSTPKAVNNVFTVGSLASGEEKEIMLTGTLTGVEGDIRNFRFFAGTLRAADGTDFSVTYGERDAAVTITKPFLAVKLAVNQSDSDTVVIPTDRPVTVLVSWQNTLDSNIQNASISVSLSGAAIDPASVKAVGGFYSSSKQTVLFSRDSISGLGNLVPGTSGSGSITFSLKSGAALKQLRNASVTLSASISGQRVTESAVPEQVSSTLTRTLNLASDLSVSGSAIHTTGVYPPVADKETMYAITLQAGNSVNAIANATVSFTLPSYVRYTGGSSSSSLTYNDATRQVTWNIGEFPAGASQSVSFGIALLPSSSQHGTNPILTSPMNISGFDRFVQANVNGSAAGVVDPVGSVK